jgi:predicted Zn-dependent protease
MRLKKPVYLVIFILISLILFQSMSFATSLVDSLTLGLEKNIGLYNYETITSKKLIAHLPQAEEQHLNKLFQRLVRSCDRSKELKYNLTFVKDNSVNAFALPGGYVFVNTGLLSFVKSDGELAGILGHELAHIDRRHTMKSIYRGVGFTIGLSLLLKDSDEAKRNQTMARIAGVSMRMAELGYSRGAELEADRYGVEIMERSGYNRKDILSFWQRLNTRSGPNFRYLTILSTHPPTTERIKQIEELP